MLRYTNENKITENTYTYISTNFINVARKDRDVARIKKKSVTKNEFDQSINLTYARN